MVIVRQAVTRALFSLQAGRTGAGGRRWQVGLLSCSESVCHSAIQPLVICAAAVISHSQPHLIQLIPTHLFPSWLLSLALWYCMVLIGIFAFRR